MLKAVEEGVGRILHALEKKRQLENTLVIFTSDQGYFYGEHGLSVERRLAYEESIRIPLLMRYPPLARAGSIVDGFALGIDIAPTVLEIAGAKPEYSMHGRSSLPLLRGDADHWRKSFAIEYFSDKTMPRISQMGYRALRTERWKYIHYTELKGMDELYDLGNGPVRDAQRDRERGCRRPGITRGTGPAAGAWSSGLSRSVFVQRRSFSYVLESEPKPKADCALCRGRRRYRARNRHEVGWCRDIGVWLIQGRGVGDVQRFRTELQVVPFTEPEFAE